MPALLDLVLPLECGGCGAPRTRWCDACAAALMVHADEPVVVTPRIDPGVPVFALGRYAGVRRQAIVALKEHAHLGSDMLVSRLGPTGKKVCLALAQQRLTLLRRCGSSTLLSRRRCPR